MMVLPHGRGKGKPVRDVLNAGAAPATVSDEPSPKPLGFPGKAAIRQRPASQETCHQELCFGGVGAGCTGRERACRSKTRRRDPTKLVLPGPKMDRDISP